MMLELPRIGREPDDAEVSVPMSYRKYVEKHMSKVERLLKLVATPSTMLVEHFRMMWPEGGSKELQVVMVLKGLKRAEQVTLLETFGGQAPPLGALGDGDASTDLKARAIKMGGESFQKMKGMGSMFK